MTIAVSCLDHDSLRSLLEHGANPDEIERLAEHLETCTRCGETVDGLLASDPTEAALRGAKVEVDEPSVQMLRARLANLRTADASHETTAGENTQSAVSPPSFEATQNNSVSLAPPQQPDEIGRLGGYRILAELGRGGMGVVYKAEDLKLKRLVALKVMAPNLAANAVSRERFLREAVAMAAVHHDNIVVIHTVDEDNGVPFLAMEFLKGMPLDKWLKDGRKATPAQVLKIGREIAEGLAAAHERGLIHRDIKPGNIWLDSAHKGRVKILDFGLARSGTEDVHLTQSGAIVGTPAYMSPEQARSEKVDGRSDLFSLGCVLYRLCTGAMPFAGDTTMSLLMSLALDHPKTVRELNPDMPAALSDLVMRLLAKKPEDRPQLAREVIQAIQAISRAPVERAAGFIPAERTQPGGINPAARTATIAPSRVTAPASGGKKRRRWVMAAVAAGFVAAAVVAAIVVIIRDKDGKKIAEVDAPPGSTVTITNNEKGESVAATKPTVDDAWIKQVAGFPADKQVEAVASKLKELNPGFDGKVTPAIEGGRVTAFRFLADDVTDVSPVRALLELKSLTCYGSSVQKSRFSDLSPLKSMKLTSLFIENTRVTDLSPLDGMELTTLDFDGTPVSDLSPLKNMPLTALNCSGAGVSDLSLLKDMKLIDLCCWHTPLSDLSAVKDMKLTSLKCDGTRLSDLSPLKGMPLMFLSCPGTPVSDLSSLKGMPLTVLICDGAPITDLSPLKGMPLISLSCSRIKASDLSPLKGLPLKNLYCDFDAKRDADILHSIKTLETINGKPAAELWKEVDAPKLLAQAPTPKPPLDEAWFKGVAALPPEKQVDEVAAELKRRNPGFDGKMKPQIGEGRVWDLEFCTDSVTDVTPVRALTRMTQLHLSGSDGGKGRLTDLSPLKGMRLGMLAVINNQANDLSVLKDLPLLTAFSCDSNPELSDLSPLQGAGLTSLHIGKTRVSDLSPLKGMPLRELSCGGTSVTDLSPLRGMPLASLSCNETNVSDFSPLKGMALAHLDYRDTLATDLSVLKDMPLKDVYCDTSRKVGFDILRSIKTLEMINGKPAAEFWKDVDGKNP